jgi:hypothetical protein
MIEIMISILGMRQTWVLRGTVLLERGIAQSVLTIANRTMLCVAGTDEAEQLPGVAG